MTGEPVRYPKRLRQLHWLLALLLVSMVLFGLWMGTLDRTDPLKTVVLPWHLVTGGVVFALTAWRLTIRRRSRALFEAARTESAPARRALAGFVHGAFYLLLLGLPLLGFGVWVLDPHLGPAPFGDGVAVGNWSERLHRIHYLGAWSVTVLLPLHVAGALIRDRAGHRPLSRML
ncbi:cytochrome b/b6 domain-containing protein [Halomonas denitrificans]|nr:cytochrome b/b6 domain-containing protein [Halomonas denitrificans]